MTERLRERQEQCERQSVRGTVREGSERETASERHRSSERGQRKREKSAVRETTGSVREGSERHGAVREGTDRDTGQ